MKKCSMQNMKSLEKYDVIRYLWKTYVCSPYFFFCSICMSKRKMVGTPRFFFCSKQNWNWASENKLKTNEMYAYLDSFHLNTMRSNTRKYSPDAVLCYFNESSFAPCVYARVNERLSVHYIQMKTHFSVVFNKRRKKKINNMPHENFTHNEHTRGKPN